MKYVDSPHEIRGSEINHHSLKLVEKYEPSNFGIFAHFYEIEMH